MPKLMTKKKQKHVKRFFDDPKKVLRLTRAARKKQLIGFSTHGYPSVYRINIGGRKLAVKYTPEDALFARYSLEKILSEHRAAVKKGVLSSSTYSLAASPYVFSTKNVEITKEIPGVGVNSLFSFFFAKNKESRPDFVKEREFVRKHPSITVDFLKKAYAELGGNLNQLKATYKIPSFDLHGTNNVIIKGFDKKTNKIVFALIDQMHPFEVGKSIRFFREDKRAQKRLLR